MPAVTFSEQFAHFEKETTRRFIQVLGRMTYPPEGYDDGTFACVLMAARKAGMNPLHIANEIGIDHQVFERWVGGRACPGASMQNRVVVLVYKQLLLEHSAPAAKAA